MGHSILPERSRAFRVANLVVVSSCVLLAPFAEASARAEFQQPGARVLENRIPKHVPIQVSFCAGKEAAFKKLDNEEWLIPKTVILLFARMNFGNGSGLDGGDARPVGKRFPQTVTISRYESLRSHS